jgi:4-aminobutyrate aminotransferase-like enzyme
MPPKAGLDSVMFVNSGSEANDIAWRIAAGVTGRDGGIVTHFAYHGVTDAIADLSPEEWPEGFRPPRVARIPADGGGEAVATAASELAKEGHALAATFVDAGLTSDGIYPLAPDSLAAIVQATHNAGGLFVADEVQVGYGRSGEHLWTFAHLGATPDFVTLGKPMGNGYPVAAVLTRREIIDEFAFAGRVFSTFGGNPVAAQAGLAVLDVIRDERIIPNVRRVGGLLRRRIEELQSPEIIEVRGLGLLVGVQLDDPARAKEVLNAMRERGVLIGRTGPNEDVLKIRPPLVFDDEHVDLLVAALDESLKAGS